MWISTIVGQDGTKNSWDVVESLLPAQLPLKAAAVQHSGPTKAWASQTKSRITYIMGESPQVNRARSSLSCRRRSSDAFRRCGLRKQHTDSLAQNRQLSVYRRAKMQPWPLLRKASVWKRALCYPPSNTLLRAFSMCDRIASRARVSSLETIASSTARCSFCPRRRRSRGWIKERFRLSEIPTLTWD